MPTFVPVEVGLAIDGAPVKSRGTSQQTDTGLLWTPPQIRIASTGGNPAYTATNLGGYALAYVSVQHSAGATAGFVACGVRLANRFWKAGQWTDATTTYTDDTTDAQDTDTNDFAAETTTNSDGFLVAATTPFNCISANVTTAADSATRAMSYSTSAGWSAAYTAHIAWPTGGTISTGENVILWSVPTDWAPMTVALHGTGVPVGYYGARFRATTAPATNVALVKAMEVSRMFFVRGAVAASGTITNDFGGRAFVLPPEGDGLVGLVQTPGTTQPTCFTFLVALGG